MVGRDLDSRAESIWPCHVANFGPELSKRKPFLHRSWFGRNITGNHSRYDNVLTQPAVRGARTPS
jgi:hypothetical protein